MFSDYRRICCPDPLVDALCKGYSGTILAYRR
ncbi:hypothetical protein SOVF_175120, partial [Spinacia oleracea]